MLPARVVKSSARHHHGSAVDQPGPGDDPVGGDVAADQAAELAERTLVQEVADAAAGIQLALAVMLGQALVTTHRTGMSPATGELAESFLPVPGPGHRYLLSSVATRPAALTILNCLL